MNDSEQDGDRQSFWNRRNIQIGIVVLVVLAVAVLLATSRGCRRSSRVSKGTAQDTPEKEAAQRNELFDTAWSGLQRPEVFDGMFGTDEELAGAMDRLDQWLQAQRPLDDWREDRLVASLAKPLASFVQHVRPVDAALTQPGYALELKDVARRFEGPAARLESLGQRRSLQELDQLARKYDESAKAIDKVAREIADAYRESRQSSGETVVQGKWVGAYPDATRARGEPGRDAATARPQAAEERDVENDLRAYEAQFLDNFFAGMRDPARRATFDGLYEVARLLDYPGRLREGRPLAALARAMEDFAAKHDRQEVEALVSQYEGVVSRNAKLIPKSRLSMQLRFIAGELDNAGRIKDLAEWKELDQVVGEAAERLKIAAKRTGRGELGDLAAQIDEARNKRDVSAVKGLAAQLAASVRPNDVSDLKDCAAPLKDGAETLAKLAGQIGQLAKQRPSENLEGLADYVGKLAAEMGSVAGWLADPPQTTDPRKPVPLLLPPIPLAGPPQAADPPQTTDLPKLAAELQPFTLRFAMLTARVRRLAETLDYFATLGALHFHPADRSTVREAILMRDLSRWARGEEADDVSRAKRLFDWVVRNIQLEPDKEAQGGRPGPRFLKRPWETLIWGVGTAMDRAWVFILLARQQGLDAAVLALDDPADPAHGRLRPWTVAVLSEGNLYLFDPYLGLPIPGPGGVKLDASGQLDVRPATLAMVLGDERVLRQMDLDPLSPYRVKASDLKRVVALVEGSPAYAAQRMQLIESRLVSGDRLVLSAAPAAQAERLKTCVGIADVRLWSLPYETLFQRSQAGDETIRQAGSLLQLISSGALWKGRVRHLEGKFTGDSNAVKFYGKARLSDREIESLSGAAKLQEGRLATSGSARDAEMVAASVAGLKAIAVLARQDASYWLGLAAFEQGKYDMASDYFSVRTLAASPDGPWTPGAKYNLGRVYEAQKNYLRAIQQYRGTAGSAQSYGDQLRAQWLEKLTAAELPALPGLPKEKEAPKKEGPSKPGPSDKEKPGAGELPKLPGLPKEKEPPKADERTQSK